MLEKDIVNAIMKYLRSLPSCFCWKEHGGHPGYHRLRGRQILCFRGQNGDGNSYTAAKRYAAENQCRGRRRGHRPLGE